MSTDIAAMVLLEHEIKVDQVDREGYQHNVRRPMRKFGHYIAAESGNKMAQRAAG